jgi:hypothetical protein
MRSAAASLNPDFFPRMFRSSQDFSLQKPMVYPMPEDIAAAVS